MFLKQIKLILTFNGTWRKLNDIFLISKYTIQLLNKLSAKYRFSAVVQKEEKCYVLVSRTWHRKPRVKQLKKQSDNLKEAVEFYLEDEDVKIPARQVFTTKIEVPSHVKTSHALSSWGNQGSQQLEFQVISQKASHIKMKKKALDKTLVVIIPDRHEIPAGTLKSIIWQAGMTDEELVKLL